jgi:hypothetical protein
VAPTGGAEHVDGGGLVSQSADDGCAFAATHSRGVNSPGVAATSAGEARSTLRTYSCKGARRHCRLQNRAHVVEREAAFQAGTSARSTERSGRLAASTSRWHTEMTDS